MATKKRQIDVVSTNLTFIEESTDQQSFADILGFMNNKDYRFHGKLFEFSILATNLPGCILGLIVTTQDKDIPPIRDKSTKIFSQVAINPLTQGLAFANVFLYDTTRNILLYEINRNGCFLNQFKEFIFSKWNSVNEDIHFNLTFPAVIRSNEYNRMLNMDYYKKITIELYKPSELLHCFDEENDSIQNSILKHNIQISQQSNADALIIEQIALTKKINPMGLSRSMVKGLVDAVKLNILDKGHRENIQTLQIDGYASDIEDSRSIKQINILADTFNEYFSIQNIQIQSDVQESERKIGIELIYNRLLPELITLAG